MNKIKKELKYSINDDEIIVWLTDVWPLGHIYTDNYELIDYVLNDINKNYLTINGAVFYVPNNDNEIREVMAKNDFELMNRAYKIEAKNYEIDRFKYRCGSVVTDKEREYYANHLNELYNVKTGFDVFDNKIENGHMVYVFYDKNDIVGIVTMLFNDGDIDSLELFANNKDIAVDVIKYILAKFKKNIYITVVSEHKILLDALDEIDSVVVWSNYCSKHKFDS